MLDFLVSSRIALLFSFAAVFAYIAFAILTKYKNIEMNVIIEITFSSMAFYIPLSSLIAIMITGDAKIIFSQFEKIEILMPFFDCNNCVFKWRDASFL